MNALIGIVGFSIRNWRMVIGVMIFAVLGGVLSLDRLPVDAEPDIPVPYVTVKVVLPGVSPEDSERLLVRPMETEIKSIEGIKQINSIAATNVAQITVEFDISHDLDKALSDVIEKVDRARADFPKEALEPIIEEVSTSTLPIIVVNLWGDAPERELQKRAKEVQSRLETLPEVLEAKITGERINVLEAIVDPSKADSLNITIDEILLAVNQNNTLVPTGSLQTNNGKFNIKVPGLIEESKDLSNTVIRRGENDSIIRMSDIATVRNGYKDIENIARFNKRNSVSLEISKRQGENILETETKVQEVLSSMTKSSDWPSTINITYSQSRAQYIREMVKELSSSIINAVILVFIVCIAALGWRSAIFVGWAIPASFLIAFCLFYIQGQTINMMILFGLILSVGVLVDSAIVIVEYADRKMDEGLPRREAFQMAGERMFWPIVSSTATTLVAFVPLLFWETITGKFMSYMPLTMIYVLTASMLMALVFLPTLGSLIGFKPTNNEKSNAALLAGVDGDPSQLKGFTGLYVATIKLLIKYPLLVISTLILICILIVQIFNSSVDGPPPKPIEFFTQTPSDQIFVLARTRGNGTPEQSMRIATLLEDRITKIEGIQSVYTIVGPGAAGQGGEASMNSPDNVPIDSSVRIYTELIPFSERERTISNIIEDLEIASSNIPGVLTEITAIGQGPPIDKDIGIQISSNNRNLLKKYTLLIHDKLASVDGVYDTEDTLPLPGIDWSLKVDRAEAGRLGLDIENIGNSLQFVTEGALIGRYRPLDVDEEVDIRLRYPSSARDISQLDSLRIQTPQGAIPISNVVKRLPNDREDKIARRDLMPFYLVQGNTKKGYATNKQVELLKNWIKEEANIPAEIKIKFLGQAEENAEAGQFAIAAFISILLMMGVILLLQFNSFYHVFLTLSAVVISVFGVMAGLIFYSYISMILVLTGVIALAGIVVNNNIVLIDTYQRLTKAGFKSEEAAIRTAAQRLRPVVLTTTTTIVGLMPLVLGWSANIFTGEFSTLGSSTSDIWAPISYVLSAGLGFATILTLIITPVMLAMPSVLKKRIQKFRSSNFFDRKKTIQ
jgi:multidrug efflux pump